MITTFMENIREGYVLCLRERLTNLKYPVTKALRAYVCSEGVAYSVKNPYEIVKEAGLRRL
ncbi:hypothetical protein DRO69_06045 [Candidatus Bathyarchaeota archaeon]|nr:MAG: hypothetical protein DRO69_06045 [Candidatus Bathyarchaeota archaeon]